MLHSDMDGIGPDCKPTGQKATYTGASKANAKAEEAMRHKMKLTKEEQAILDGKEGEEKAKLMKILVTFGNAFGAEKLVDLGGAPHSNMFIGAPYMKSMIKMLDECARAGLKSYAPYTVNPRPYDVYNVQNNPKDMTMIYEGYSLQWDLDYVHVRLGAAALGFEQLDQRVHHLFRVGVAQLEYADLGRVAVVAGSDRDSSLLAARRVRLVLDRVGGVHDQVENRLGKLVGIRKQPKTVGLAVNLYVDLFLFCVRRNQGHNMIDDVANAASAGTHAFRWASKNEGGVLYFQLSSAHTWWLAARRRQGRGGPGGRRHGHTGTGRESRSSRRAWRTAPERDPGRGYPHGARGHSRQL